MENNEKIRRELHFSYSAEISGQPLICDLMREFSELSFNIIKAQITPRKEGYLVLGLEGLERDIQSALSWLKDRGVKSSRQDLLIRREEALCMHCGMCMAMCPSGALSMDAQTRLLHMNSGQCSACGLCARICPVNAMIAERAPII